VIILLKSHGKIAVKKTENMSTKDVHVVWPLVSGVTCGQLTQWAVGWGEWGLGSGEWGLGSGEWGVWGLGTVGWLPLSLEGPGGCQLALVLR
jgi:hypothetical protein